MSAMPDEQAKEKLAQVGLRSDDVAHIEAHGLTLAAVAFIIDKLQGRRRHVHLHRAATHKDGVRGLPDLEQRLARYDDLPVKPGKLTPMSGATSRMFGFLDRFLVDQPEEGDAAKVERFIRGLAAPGDGPRLPFRDELAGCLARAGHDLEQLIRSGRHHTIIDYLLADKGLGYRTKPKAIIPFHRRGGRPVVPLEEHMTEALSYGGGRLHITISPEHEQLVAATLEQIRRDNPALREVAVSHSVQHPSTDSVALDDETGQLVRDEDGRIAFFPAGHGALVANINNLDHPVILRNVDNVPRSAAAQLLIERYHKAMAVLLWEVKGIATRALLAIEEGSITEAELDATLEQLRQQQLGLHLDEAAYRRASLRTKKVLAQAALDRPLKIVGVVPNKGEPGGGPFVIDYAGREHISIVEKSEIAAHQKHLMKTGEFFNPVDILVDPTNHRGENHDLARFVNNERHILVVHKPYRSRMVTRMERPGLWNGAMDGYSSIFVCLPIETFAPVKEVIDLLRPQHQPGLAPNLAVSY